MAEQKRTTETQDEKLRRQEIKQEAAAREAARQAAFAASGGGPLGPPDDIPIQTVAARLGDTRFQSVQRQAMAERIRRVSGNQFLQRTVAQTRRSERGEAAARGQRWPAADGTTLKQAPTQVVQRFAEKPHVDIEQEALGGIYNAPQLEEIAFGNWQNDFNQISLIIEPVKTHLGIPLTSEDTFEIAKIIAETKFGERIAKQMNKDRFGQYEPRQHFDNPLDADEPLGGEAVPKYIQHTIAYIKATFQKAIAAGQTPVGREFYGSALHIMEDYFAHSNFVEIALTLRGIPTDTQAGRIVAGGDKGRYRLASGIFETLDTIVSILKIIAAHMSKPPEPGGKAIGTGDKITLVFLRRKDRKLARLYTMYLHSIHAAKKWIPGFKFIYGVAQKVKAQVSSALAGLISLLSAGLATQTGAGLQPSHSKLNKDDPSTKHYKLAKALALHVVRQVDPKMRAVWEGRTPTAQRELMTLVDQLMAHPDSCRWWYPIVDSYKGKSGGAGAAPPAAAGAAAGIGASIAAGVAAAVAAAGGAAD